MDVNEIKNIVEALLLTSAQPISMEQILSAFEEYERPTPEQILLFIEELKEDYAAKPIELLEVASGYCFQTKTKYASWVFRLNSDRPAKYSRAFLETLAIIAYKQPVTRGEIEEIRGVAVSSHIMKTLLEREWIRVAGHKDVPGKPAVYTTTKEFLNYFSLSHLNQLPPLPDLKQELTSNEEL